MLRPDAGHGGDDWKHPCHYLWRGPMYVKQNGDVYRLLPELHHGGRPGGESRAALRSKASGTPTRCGACAVCTSADAAGEIDVCAKCCTTIPHKALVVGSLLLHGKTVRRLLPVVERLTYLVEAAAGLAEAAAGGGAGREELVQIKK